MNLEFAIDFFQLGSNNAAVDGPSEVLTS